MPRKRNEVAAYAVKTADRPSLCIAYSRMSSSKQGESPKDQQASIERIVARFQLPFNGEAFTDHGVSGWKVRDELEALITAVGQQRRADGLILRSLSRLTRQPVTDAMRLLQKLREAGIKWLFTEDRGEIKLPESGDFAGWLLLVVECGVSYDAARTIGYHVTQSFTASVGRSISEAAKQKGWSETGEPRTLKHTGGRTPFGFRDEVAGEEGEKVFRRFHDEFAPIVREIFRMFLAGKTARAIATWLTNNGVPTKSGRPYWSGESVDAILGNQVYAGTYVRGKLCQGAFYHSAKSGPSRVPDEARQGRKNSIPAAVLNDDVFELDDCWEPVVTKRNFARVQEMLSERRKKLEKPRATSGALSGILVCSHCGRKLRLHRFNNRSNPCVADGCERNEAGVTLCEFGGHVLEQDVLPQLFTELHKALDGETKRLTECLARPAASVKVVANWERKVAELDKRIQNANHNLERMMQQANAAKALQVAIDAVERLNVERQQLLARQQEALMPADRAQEMTERIAWLKKNAVEVWKSTLVLPNGRTEVEFIEDDKEAAPDDNYEMTVNDLDGVPGKAHLYGERMAFDAEKVRQLSAELGLSVSAFWAGKPGDSKRGRVRQCRLEFSVNDCSRMKPSPGRFRRSGRPKMTYRGGTSSETPNPE